MAWHCVKWSEDQWLSSKQFFYCLLCPALPSHQTPKQCYSSGVPFLRGFIAFASKTRLKYFQICLVREGKGPTAAPEFTFPAESSPQPRESRRPEWVSEDGCACGGGGRLSSPSSLIASSAISDTCATPAMSCVCPPAPPAPSPLSPGGPAALAACSLSPLPPRPTFFTAV